MLLRTELIGTGRYRRFVAVNATLAPPILRVPDWRDVPQLTHGFCGRRGGISDADFASLNLSLTVGDDPALVRENWRRLHAHADASRFVTMQQRHGAEVAEVDARVSSSPQADAMISRAGGIALCVLTADCVPILLLAPEQRVIAAVHAGWRGTVLGIVLRTVQSMRRAFGVEPSKIQAALGPAIGGCCYEVERDITDDLQGRWGAMPEAVTARGAKSQLDLRRANCALLARAGLPAASIRRVGPCTRCAAADYFSYRAARVAGAAATGRQVSFIAWQV